MMGFATLFVLASLQVRDVDPACAPLTPVTPLAPLTPTPTLSLTPPGVSVVDDKVSFDVSGARVGDLLAAIATKAKVTIVGAGDGLQAPITGFIDGAPLEDAVRAVANAGGLVVSPSPGRSPKGVLAYELVDDEDDDDPAASAPSPATKAKAKAVYPDTRGFVVLAPAEMHTFLLGNARDREKALPTTVRMIAADNARDAEAWVTPLANIVLGCRAGVSAVPRSRTLLVEDIRDNLDGVEPVIVGANKPTPKQKPTVVLLDIRRRESVARVAPCPLSGPLATNANALAIAHEEAKPRGRGKVRGSLVGCPAPVPLLAGDVARARELSFRLLDLGRVVPPAIRAVSREEGGYDEKKYEVADANSIFVATRRELAEAIESYESEDDEVAFAVTMPSEATADLFASVLAIQQPHSRVMRAPGRVVVARGPRKLQEDVTSLAERLAER